MQYNSTQRYKGMNNQPTYKKKKTMNLMLILLSEMLDWKKHKLESRLPEEISITSDMQMTPPLWQKVKRN